MNFRFRVLGAVSLVILTVASIVLPFRAAAQGIITGSATGTVEDASGAVIKGAEITMVNTTTGTTAVVTSDSAGGFNFQALPIGIYQATIKASGFAAIKLDNVKIEAGKAAGLGVQKLEIGASTVSVEVSAATGSLIETVQSQVTTTFDTEQIQNLPTGGGLDELALLIPGVVSAHDNRFENINGATISSNGQRGRSNNFEIDGQSNNDNSVTGPQVFFKNQDALQEVQIITNQFSAQYGRDAGSVVNYITKSGTNKIHGTAFEYYEGSWLSSLANSEKGALFVTTPRKARFTNNRYGGSLGFPVLKDKLFGFGSALFSRNFSGPTVSSTGSSYFPTAASIAALKTAYPNNPGVASLAAYNPFAVKLGTVTPIGTIRNVSVSDGTTSTTIQIQPYTRAVPNYNTDEELLGRVDYQVTSKDRVYLRYLYQNNPFYNAAGTVTTGGLVNVLGVTHSVGADWTRTLTSNLTNQIRYSFQQSRVSFDGGGFSSCTITSLQNCPSSFSLGNATDVTGKTVTLGGFGLSTTYPQGRIVKDTQVQDNLNWTRGRHNFAIGGAFEYQNSPNVFLPNVSGSFTFPSLNSLLANTPTTVAVVFGNANIHFTEPDYAVYFQDDWKVSPSFTANLGLRWEFFGQSINLLHDLSVAQQTGSTPLWNTALPLSTTTFPKVPDHYKNFEPRIGFAWNPSQLHELVVRGGYAINVTPAFSNIFTNAYGTAPVVLSASISGCNSTTKQCLPTGGANYVSVHAQDSQYLTRGGNPGSFSQTTVAPNFHQPLTQNFSLGVEYQLTRAMVGEVRYVGSHTSGDFQSINANPYLAPVAAAFPNIVSPSSLCTSTTSTLPGGADVGRLHCGATNVRSRMNTSFEVYNGLQTTLRTAAYHGFTGSLSYTWSRTVDNASEIFSTAGGGTTNAFAQNPLDTNTGERGVSGISYPNVTTLGLTYKLPFFERQRNLKSRLLGGFQINTIYVFNSGQPYTPAQEYLEGSFCDEKFGPTYIGVTDACRPILANKNAPLDTVGVNAGGGVYQDYSTGDTISRSSVHWLINNQAEALALHNPFPGVGRNTLRGDSYNNADMSVYKTTPLTERVSLQLQLTAFNALNRAYYGAPDAFVEDSGVGGTFTNYSGNSGNERDVQIGGKIIF